MNIAFGWKTASTVYFSFDDDGDVLAARPTPLVEVRPQSGEQRHTVEQIIETFVPVQVLDALVPQMGTQLAEFMQKRDTATPEQVIEVPKLSQDRNPQRFAVRRPQKAEQLVELPTVLSFSSLQQQSAEQNAQNRVQQHRFLLRNAFPSGLWSRALTFPFLEAACMFSLILVGPAHPKYRVMSVGKVFFFFFGLFPESK